MNTFIKIRRYDGKRSKKKIQRVGRVEITADQNDGKAKELDPTKFKKSTGRHRDPTLEEYFNDAFKNVFLRNHLRVIHD